MSHTNLTARLNTDNWDLALDRSGNIELVSQGYAICQNLANEIRLWTQDAYFQSQNGIDWKEAQLAKKTDQTVLASLIREAGERTEGVISVDNVTLETVNFEDRILHGQIEITTEFGKFKTSF